MKHAFSILIVFCFYAFPAISQKPILCWGEEIKDVSNKKSIMAFGEREIDNSCWFVPNIGKIDDDILCVSHKSNRSSENTVLYKLSAGQMELKEAIQLPRNLSENDNLQSNFKGAYFWNKKICLFDVCYNQNYTKGIVKVETFSANGSKILKKECLVLEEKPIFSKKDVYIVFCEDSTKLAVVAMIGNNETKNITLLIKLFDADFNELTKNKIEIPYEFEETIFGNIKFLKDGQLYFPVKTYFKKAPRGLPSYENYLYQVSTDGTNNMTIYKIELDTKWINCYNYLLDSKDNLIVAGFYSEKSEFSSKGHFYQVYEKNDKTPRISEYKNFSDEFRKAYLRGYFAKKDAEIWTLRITDFLKRKDGSTILIFEEGYSFGGGKDIKVNAKGNLETTTSNTLPNYFYDDIGIFNIDPQGKITWFNFIHKHMVSIFRNEVTFGLLATDDQLCFVYIEKIDQFNKSDKAKLKETRLEGKVDFAKKSLVVAVVIDNNGKKQKFNLSGTEKTGLPKYALITYTPFNGKELVLSYNINTVGKVILE